MIGFGATKLSVNHWERMIGYTKKTIADDGLFLEADDPVEWLTTARKMLKQLRRLRRQRLRKAVGANSGKK